MKSPSLGDTTWLLLIPQTGWIWWYRSYLAEKITILLKFLLRSPPLDCIGGATCPTLASCTSTRLNLTGTPCISACPTLWQQEIEVETVVEIVVEAVVKTGCHTTLYNGPLQRQTRSPRYTILFRTTILFTILSSSPTTTGIPRSPAVGRYFS